MAAQSEREIAEAEAKEFLNNRVELTGHDVFTCAEVAEVFNVSATTVKRWAKTGRISAFRTLGGAYRFHRSDIEKILQGQKTR